MLTYLIHGADQAIVGVDAATSQEPGIPVGGPVTYTYRESAGPESLAAMLRVRRIVFEKKPSGKSKGVRTMAKPREPWNIRPAKKPASVTASLKTEVEMKARDLIENVLKPKHVLPPPKKKLGNYITDIGAKWYRGYFYFFTTYACPGPNALAPTFEWKFARMEPLRDGKFALYALRYTGKEWVGVLDALSVDECMKAIKDDEWFAM